MEGLPGDPVHRRRHPARGGGVLSASTENGPRRVVLLRHGRTAHNADGVIQGQLDVPLDDVGRAQARACAEALAPAQPALIVSSDLSRASDTAAVLGEAAGVAVRLDERLRELHLGAWQGLTGEQARERFPSEHAAWRRGDDVARGGGETYTQAGARALRCLVDVTLELPAGATAVLVTHGGTARALLGALLEVDPTTWWRFAPLGNTCWSVLVEGEHGWRLERHNAGLGPLVGPATGAHDLGSRPVADTAASGGDELGAGRSGADVR